MCEIRFFIFKCIMSPLHPNELKVGFDDVGPHNCFLFLKWMANKKHIQKGERVIRKNHMTVRTDLNWRSWTWVCERFLPLLCWAFSYLLCKRLCKPVLSNSSTSRRQSWATNGVVKDHMLHISHHVAILPFFFEYEFQRRKWFPESKS